MLMTLSPAGRRDECRSVDIGLNTFKTQVNWVIQNTSNSEIMLAIQSCNSDNKLDSKSDVILDRKCVSA